MTRRPRAPRSNKTSGKLICFGSSLTGASRTYDRHLYLTDTGNLVFGVTQNTDDTVTSTATYLDGQWHDAISTLAPSGDLNPGIRLYVDGALVASDPTGDHPKQHDGYWRMAHDNLNGRSFFPRVLSAARGPYWSSPRPVL